VDVTIDVDTANRFITVSDDGKTVSSGSSDPLPDSPTRFKSLPFALGKPGFTSGRHYWEVEVSKKTEWILGLAKESVDKKSTLTLSPENGCWTLSLDSVYGIEAVYDPVVRLYVKYLPQKIGIYLDYEGKSVSFYDAKRKAHLHTFNDTFTEALYPFFSPGNIYENLNLIITPLSDIQ
ncbi:E3 ubiquitin-protein ligase TRIM39-like, partial [Huso huso]